MGTHGVMAAALERAAAAVMDCDASRSGQQFPAATIQPSTREIRIEDSQTAEATGQAPSEAGFGCRKSR